MRKPNGTSRHATTAAYREKLVPKASANPTKAFFVSMMTRDITLEDCILDLIDNSIDAAWRGTGPRSLALDDGKDLSPYKIEIVIKDNEFKMVDNCGGLTIENAMQHAFSFGRGESNIGDRYSIGVYGIGMKRAAFKIGTRIRIHSTYKDDNDKRHGFVVPIDVNTWLSNDTLPWDFDIEEQDPFQFDGVSIDISSLTSGAIRSFNNPAFVENLRRIISRDYSLHLNRGLTIFINGKTVPGTHLKLRQSEDFAPVRQNYKDRLDNQAVTVEIIGGMAAQPPEDVNPSEQDTGEQRYGWYVACNGRIVLAADKTVVSGWGTRDWPQWHRQYSGFLGIVLFTSANASVLPLTTTKRSVDVSSEIFLRARREMHKVSRQWISYTNRRKSDLERAKVKERSTTAVPIHSLPLRKTVALPAIVGPPRERPANVHYSVPRPRMKKLAREFGRISMPYREVGIKSFEYAYKDLVGDE